MLQKTVNTDYGWNQYSTLSNLLVSNNTLVATGTGTPFPSSMSAWTNRVKITVDNTKVDADLTDFPVYVNLNNLPSTFFDIVLSNGTDIKVTTSDEETNCPRELVAIDTVADTGELWFKAPTLNNATDTVFYIYYGKAAGGETNNTATWETNFKAVYHNSDATTSTVSDSTSNANTGNKTGAGEPVEAAGKIGKAQTFDGTNDRITATDSTSINAAFTGDFTVSMWFKTAATLTDKVIWKRTDNLKGYMQLSHYPTAGTFRLYDGSGGDLDALDTTATNLNNDAWRYVAAQRSGDTLNFFVDGAASGTRTRVAGTSADSNLFIGFDGTSRFIAMALDEFRVAATARAVTWINTEYNNQNSPSTFYTVGAQETGATVGFGTYISQTFNPSGGWVQLGWVATSGTYSAKLSILNTDNTYFAGYSGLTAATVNLSGLSADTAYRVQIQISGLTTTNVGSYYVGYPGQFQVQAGLNAIILDKLTGGETYAGGRDNTGYFRVSAFDANSTLPSTYKKNDEIQLFGSSNIGSLQTKLMGGYIDDIQNDSKTRITTITGRGYGGRMQEYLVNKTFTAIEVGSIVRELAGNVPDITTSNISGTSTTPTTWAINDEDVWTTSQKLADHVGYLFFVDKNKAAYFQPEAYTGSSAYKALYGTNILTLDQTTLGQSIVNTIRVYGQIEIVSGLGSFTGDGVVKSYALNQIPRSPLNKVQTPSGTTKTEFTDFDVNYQGGTLLFAAAPGSQNAIYVDYKYNRDVFASANVSASEPTYGSITKKIYNDSLVTGSDAQTFATAWANAHSGAQTIYKLAATRMEAVNPRDAVFVYHPRYNQSGNLTVVDVKNTWRPGEGLKQEMTLGKIIPDVTQFLGGLSNRLGRIETNYKNTGFGTPLTSTQTESEDSVGSATWVWYALGSGAVARNCIARNDQDYARPLWTLGSTVTVNET